MTFKIELEGCINCGWCRRACPTDTIHFFLTQHRTHVIDPTGCIDCAICARVCPVNVISHDPTYVHDPVDVSTAKDHARAYASRQHAAKLQRRTRAEAAVQRVAAARNARAG